MGGFFLAPAEFCSLWLQREGSLGSKVILLDKQADRRMTDEQRVYKSNFSYFCYHDYNCYTENFGTMLQIYDLSDINIMITLTSAGFQPCMTLRVKTFYMMRNFKIYTKNNTKMVEKKSMLQF